MKLRYVGKKADGERAFEAQTGIVWMPGSEHEVSATHAALMLPHTDVWDVAEDDPTVALAEGPQAIGTTIGTLADAKKVHKAKRG